MRNVFTMWSMNSARSEGEGVKSAVIASGAAGGTSRLPVVDMIEVIERTRAGCSIATVCAIIPPIEAPTT